MKDKTKALIFIAVFLSFAAGCIVVSRIGVRGSAYLMSAAHWLVIFLILFPLGASQALFLLCDRRVRAMAYKSGSKIFTSAVLTTLVFVVCASAAWLGMAKQIGEKLLAGHGTMLLVMWMVPVFILDAATLILRGYADAWYRSHPSAHALLLRQAAFFVLSLLFAGRSFSNGDKVAKLFRDEEIRYVYAAATIVQLMIPVAAAGLLIYILYLAAGSGERHKLIRKDAGKRRESPSGMLYSTAFPLCFSALAFSSCEIVGQFVLAHRYTDTERILLPYQWGVYFGEYRLLCLLPFALIFLLLLDSAPQISAGVESGNIAELRGRMKSLSEVAVLIACFFGVFITALSPKLSPALFANDSLLAARIFAPGGAVVILGGIALTFSMELMLIRRRKEMIAQCVIALIPSAALIVFLSSQKVLGIYVMPLASALFFILLIALNGRMLHRALRFSPDLKADYILPLVCNAVAGIVVFVLQLLLGLFLPAIVVLIPCFIVYTLIAFILSCRTECLTSYMLRSVPLGRYLIGFGRRLHCLK